VSAKFQQINTSKITFVADSDDDNANDEDDEDDISVDTDVIAKISQKPAAVADKKTVVEKVAPVVAKTVHKPIPQEEEDDEEEEDDVEADDAVLGNVEEDAEEDEEDEDEPEPPPVKVEEPVKPDAKTKKAVVKKK
jgi:hypothetical protein